MTGERKRYGIDFDGTIADTNFMKAYWIFENLRYRVEPYRTDRTSCVPIIGLENYEKMSAVLFERKSTLKSPEIPRAIAGLETLSSIAGGLYIVSMRDKRRMQFAREWLKSRGALKYISGFGEIDNLDGTRKTKEQVCIELQLDGLVDDDERHLAWIQIPGFRKIVFKNNCPVDYKPAAGVELARSWPEIVELLAERK